MRFSSLLTLLFLLPVFLLLSCSQAEKQPSQDITELTSPSLTQMGKKANSEAPEVEPSGDQYPQHLQVALQYEGVTELSGANDGPQVERFLQAVGLRAGNPYCAAFVSFTLEEAPDIQRPEVRSALASDFITDNSIEARKVLRGLQDMPPGTILVWRKGNTIFGHAGLVIDWDKASGSTIEANTSAGAYGSQRDGEGVFKRNRAIEPGNYFRITHFTPVIYG